MAAATTTVKIRGCRLMIFKYAKNNVGVNFSY